MRLHGPASNVIIGSNIFDVDSRACMRVPVYRWSKVWLSVSPDGPDMVASAVFWLSAPCHTIVFHRESGKIGAEISTIRTPDILTLWDKRGFSGRWFLRRLAGFLIHTGCPTGSDLMDDPGPLPALSDGELEIRGTSLVPSDDELEVMSILDEPSPIWWRTYLALDFFRNRSKVGG